MPKLSPPSAADTATAGVQEARSRRLALAQGHHVYEFLDQFYGYLPRADADPELVLLTRQGLGGLGEPIIVIDRSSAEFIQMMDRYPRIYSSRFVRNAK